MKKLLILALVVIALLAAAPFGVGLYLEQQSEQQLARMQDQPGWDMEQVSYRRGWLRTDSRYRLRSTSLPEMPPLEYEVTVHHGPLPWTALIDDRVDFLPGQGVFHAWFELPELPADDGPQLIGLDALPPLGASGHIDFAGAGNFRCDYPAGKLQLVDDRDDTVELRWQDIDCGGNWSYADENGDMTLQLPKLVVESPQGSFELRGASMDYAIKEMFAPMPGSDFRMRVKTVRDAGDLGMFSLQALEIKGGNVNRGEKFDMDISYAWKSLEVMGYAVNDARFDTSFKGLTTQAWLDMNKAMETAMADSSTPGGDPDAISGMFMESIPVLLHGGEFQLNALQAELPEGAFKLSGQASLQDYDPEDVPSPLMLLGLIDASLDATAAAGIIAMATAMGAEQQLTQMQEQSETPVWETAEQRAEILGMLQQQMQQQLEAMVQEGFVVQDADNYQTRVAFTGGELTVNDKPFPLFGGGAPGP